MSLLRKRMPTTGWTHLQSEAWCFFLFYLIQHLNILCLANLFKPYIMKSGSKFLWFAVSDILLHIAKFLTRSLFSLTFFYILAYLRFSFSQFSTCLLLWPKGLDLSRFIPSPSLLFISVLYAIPFLELCYLAVSVLPFSIPSLEALSSPQRSGASHSISSHLVMQHEGHHPGFVVLTHWSSLPWHTETEVCGWQKVVDSMFRISFPWQMWSSAKVISLGRIDLWLLQILNPKVTLSFGRISRLMQNCYFEGRRIHVMNPPFILCLRSSSEPSCERSF